MKEEKKVPDRFVLKCDLLCLSDQKGQEWNFWAFVNSCWDIKYPTQPNCDVDLEFDNILSQWNRIVIYKYESKLCQKRTRKNKTDNLQISIYSVKTIMYSLKFD